MRYNKRNKSGQFCRDHGLTNHPLMRTHDGMMSRCYNKNNIRFGRYGGRGIKVCERWHKFINFYNDVKDLYRKGLTIDRIDNDGDYELDNIRFITRSENNRTSSAIKLNEDLVKTIRCELALGITQRSLAKKLNIGRHLIADVSARRTWAHI